MPEKDVQLLFLQLHIFPQAVRQTSRAEARTGISGEKPLCIKREAEAEAWKQDYAGPWNQLILHSPSQGCAPEGGPFGKDSREFPQQL